MYLCLNCQNRLHSTRCSGFGSLMNIDKLIHRDVNNGGSTCFGSLMNIDKLIPGEILSTVTVVLAL